MLEDRLSNTYSQHSLGGHRMNAPQQSSMYPSIPSEPSTSQGGAESYYNMNAPPPDAYPPQQNQYNNYAPAQTPYTQRDRAPSNTSSGYERSQHNAQAPQRAASLQQFQRSPVHRHEVPYMQSQQQQGYQSQYQPSPVEPHQTPTPSSIQDPTAAYYNTNHQPQVSPPQTYQQPQQRADHNYGSASSPEQPAQVLSQQQYHHTEYNPPQAAPPPQQQPPPYWQQPQAAPALQPQQQHYQTPYKPVNSYDQDSFPAAPSHQPQVKQAEEQLIEL